MLKNLYCSVYVNNLKNELLMNEILLNITNVFMFLAMQLLKRNSLKNIIMIYYQNILKLKRFCI